MIFDNYSMGKYTRKCNDKYNRKAVLQYSMNEEFIREWNTVGEIFRELGFDKSAILRCCKGKQQRSYWFIWKFKDDVTSLNMKMADEKSKATAAPTAIQQVEVSYTKGN